MKAYTNLPLHWKILIGMLLGIVYAIASVLFGWQRFTADFIAPFGTIFMNLLKLIAVPLVLFSIISGIAGLGSPESLGRLGLKTLAIYLATTVIAVSLGLLIVNLIKPGQSRDSALLLENRIRYELWKKQSGAEDLDDICVTCKPENAELTAVISSRMNGNGSEDLVASKIEKAKQAQNQGPLAFLVDMVPDNIFTSLNDSKLMIQVIFFGIFFGIALLYIPGERQQLLIHFFQAVTDVFLRMVDFVMRASPFFVFALLAGTISQIAGDDVSKVLPVFKSLGSYTFAVVAGLVVMAFVIYPAVIHFFAPGIRFSEFLKAISPAQLLAFSSSSSAATLPVTIECMEENMKVPKKYTSFVLPIGATVNMDGTSLYQAVAVVFLAQMHGVDLSLSQQLTIVLTATLASIGAAAVPSAGLIMLIIVLTSVHLNPAWIAIILPIDRILDMCRTVVNVTGDAMVCTLVAKSESPSETT
ncbi:MAG: dicarboxylate/amino acid:cation symporter [Thermaurantimonas sp.]|uniref:dicarboxylate/amino acid:cation symporter n=1 Tax=Thermaurantimonas sp. TaxID=2681568 RepID=UPI00391A8DF2